LGSGDHKLPVERDFIFGILFRILGTTYSIDIEWPPLRASPHFIQSGAISQRGLANANPITSRPRRAIAAATCTKAIPPMRFCSR
jgi:hypothetical protein